MTTYKKIIAILTPRERKKALFLLFLMLIGMGMEMLGIGMLIPVISAMMQGDIGIQFPIIRPVLTYFHNPTQTQIIMAVLILLLGIYLIKNTFLAILIWLQIHFTTGIQISLSQRIFNTYMHQPYTFHLQRNSAQMIRNINGEVNMFTGSISSVLQMTAEGLVMIGISILLFIAEPLGTLIVGLVLASTAWGFYRSMGKRITRWGKSRQLHDGLRMQHLMQGLGGAKDAILLGRENDFLTQYNLHNIQGARAAKLQTTLQQLPRLWLEFLAVLGMVLLMMIMFSQGREISIFLPTMVLFAGAAFRLMPSVSRILVSLQNIRYSMSAIHTVFEECSLSINQKKRIEQNKDKKISAFEKEIKLYNIIFTYPGVAVPSLNQVSLSVQKGELIGFIGPSGSGKSTLVDIILGLLTPDSGVISVDGEDIQKDLRKWQDQVGYVPQAIFLTDDTVRRNVAFGIPDNEIEDHLVQRAIQSAQLDDFVSSLSNGIQTIVGERGVRLSGGQRQRIGIARALYHNPSVLVLDEATSALDKDTENEVMRAVLKLHGKKTILIVAHRLSTVEHCDRVYRLEKGSVVAEGIPTNVLYSPV